MTPELQAKKAAGRARYQRCYARHKPVPPSHRYPAELRLTPRQKALATLRGVPEYLQQVVRMQFGSKGTWGHGRQPSGTKKGPGRRPPPFNYRTGENEPLLCRLHRAGTKLVRRFIRDARGEQVEYRRIYTALTGKQL